MAKKYTNLSGILKKLLFNRDMKPIDLAKEVNLPQPTIHRLVTGKCTRPYKSSLDPIADYFSITVDQLLGEAPLPGEQANTSLLSSQSKVKSIPTLSWASLSDLDQAFQKAKQNLIVSNTLSDRSFALIMPDSSMEPLFSQHSILIFDPEAKYRDRSYVLVEMGESKTFVFRQLLIDMDAKYLKPLNPELNRFQLRLLDNNDKIVASLVESRHNFQDHTDESLIEGN
jgi:SOS-response transcriptional repressor LexA